MQKNDRRSRLVAVFEDTKNLYEQNPFLKADVSKSLEGTRCYSADESIDCERERFSEPCRIIVTNQRSFAASRSYRIHFPERRVAVLNFANSFNPGGGVVHGAGAQEECLCRCSTLYASLTSASMHKEFYQKHLEGDDDLGTDDVIYTPDVTVFKDDTLFPDILPQSQWYHVDVLTCAAPNIRYGKNESLVAGNDLLFTLHESRLRRILDVACHNKADVVVLGAFGCGAFGNPPEVVAAASKKVLADYRKAFKAIEFAVFCPPTDYTNYEAFYETLLAQDIL